MLFDWVQQQLAPIKPARRPTDYLQLQDQFSTSVRRSCWLWYLFFALEHLWRAWVAPDAQPAQAVGFAGPVAAAWVLLALRGPGLHRPLRGGLRPSGTEPGWSQFAVAAAVELRCSL